MENKQIINKAFFGGQKNAKNCLKIVLNISKELYFSFWKQEWGKKWIHVKMNCAELGDIINVIEGRKNSIAFFHTFSNNGAENKRQIWVNAVKNEQTNERAVFIKIKELSKPLSEGEQQVLKLLLSNIIVRMSLQ